MVDEQQTTGRGPRRSGPAAPARSPAAIARDIGTERAALDEAFAALRREVGDSAAEARRQATRLGRAALVIGPAVGALAGGVAVAAVLLRRRRRDGE